ncbi:MAG: glycosyltransferase family 2 protein [Desulfobacteraceae bacterium]|nr:glycosyltransferase family 2 protein [Desulfobacteraceae bacterium]
MSIVKTPKSASIAVIIPCYNYGKFIGEAIQSVQAQTLQPEELIIVDDGSTDNTREVCENRESIKYIWKPNGGPSSARNTGHKASRAEFVLFLDADDVLKPEALEILWNVISKTEPNVAAVFGRSKTFFNSNGTGKNLKTYIPLPEDVFPYYNWKPNETTAVLSKNITERLIKGNIIPSCSAMIASHVYDEVGIWDEQLLYMEDRDMWLRIASKMSVAYVDQTIAMIRRHNNNITHSINWFRNHFAILDLLKKTYQADWAAMPLKRLAKRQYAFNAYNMAQRFAAQGDYGQAKKLMFSAIWHKPSKAKAWIQGLRYALGSIFIKQKAEL